MEGERTDGSTRIRASFRPALRVGIAGLLLGLGVSKFLTYRLSIQFFRALALPVPESLVLLVGAVGIGVAVLLLLDRSSRVAASTAAPMMIGAAVTAGPTWQNLAVLFGALVLIGIDTKIRGISVTERTI